MIRLRALAIKGDATPRPDPEAVTDREGVA